MSTDDKAKLIQIHKDDISVCEYDYIQSLPDETLIYKKSNIFLGLLEYIYKNVISIYLISDNSFNNDYSLLNEIFYNIYLPLVYKYGYTPSIYMFSSFVHISDSNLTDINNGYYRKDGSRVNSETQLTVQNWYNTCKAATITRAIDDNSIGAIFASKAAYGLRENDNPEVITTKQEPLPAIEDIEQRYLKPPKLE